jgi:hypothetical protein
MDGPPSPAADWADVPHGVPEGRERCGAAARGLRRTGDPTHRLAGQDHMRLPRCLSSGLTTDGSGVRGRRARLWSGENMDGPASPATDCPHGSCSRTARGPATRLGQPVRSTIAGVEFGGGQGGLARDGVAGGVGRDRWRGGCAGLRAVGVSAFWGTTYNGRIECPTTDDKTSPVELDTLTIARPRNAPRSDTLRIPSP